MNDEQINELLGLPSEYPEYEGFILISDDDLGFSSFKGIKTHFNYSVELVYEPKRLEAAK
jgi:hypothetical protein